MQSNAVLGVRLAACLALVATIACGSREETADRGGNRPRGPATSLANEVPLATANGPRIVILGDSLTAGLGLLPEESYPSLLQQRLRDKGLDFQVVNAGVSGDTSAGGLSRVDWALDGDARILIVALGGNDALRGLPVTQLRGNLARIIERAQERGVQVILAGMQAPTNWGAEYTRAFREVYPALARQYRIPLVPFLLDGVATVEHLNQRDGIHPNAAGARVVADLVWAVLEPVATQAAAGRQGVAAR
jgi:acyl-CoA thioesterase-1